MKNKNKFYLLLLLVAVIFMGKGYCLDTGDWGTQKFTDEFSTCLERTYTFDNFVYWNAQTTSAPTASNSITVCFFYNDIVYRINSNTSLQYRKNNSWNNMKCIQTRIDNCNNEPTGMNITSGMPTISSANSLPFNANKAYYSTIDINGTGDYSFIKNMDYTKPTCDSSGEECGPVEITNFPIDKNEFYVLLLILSTLIFMLFFKWCFPMKGGKK